MKVSVQTSNIIAQFGIVPGYRMIRACGFEGIDWNLDLAWDISEILHGRCTKCVFEGTPEEIRAHYHSELAQIKANGLSICQAHAPYPSHVAGFPELDVRVKTIYANCARFCAEIGCDRLVIHGISQLPDGSDMTRDEERRRNIELYGGLIPALEGTNVTICLENLFWDTANGNVEAVCADPNKAIDLIDTLNAMAGETRFGLCYDVGHANLLSGDHAGYLRALGDRICALHIRDNDAQSDLHKMPYSGTVRWSDFYRALRDIRYTGNLSFETYNQYDTKWMEPELVPVFLQALAQIGRIFRDKIQN